MSKNPLIEKALKLYDKGMNRRAAALEVGIAPSTLYSAIDRRKEKLESGLVECPCCGTPVSPKQIKKGSK